MEIDAANIPFQKVKGKPHAEVNVVGVAYKGDGAVGGRFSDVVSLDFPGDKEVDAFRKRPLHYEYQFDLPPGEYKLRVSFSAGEQNFGKAEAPLAIAPWDGRAFRLSSVALAKLTHPAADLTAELDLGSLEGRRPLIAGSLEIAPFGGSRFRRGEPCRWYAEIYNAKASDTTVEYRLLDRDTGRLRGNAGPKPVADFARGSGAIPVSFEVPVNSFPPGAYRLEVKAVNRASGESASSAVDLDIEQ
jgi:hypothetical protein